eukprot:9239218-Ditylum_brightwellii.AAC.1
MPQHTIFLLLSILCIMTLTITTSYGTSTTSYGGTWEDPFQTLHQGAGSASDIWLCTSAVLVSFLHDRGHVMALITPLSALTIMLVALIFMVDTYFIKHTTASSSETLSAVIPSIKLSVTD